MALNDKVAVNTGHANLQDELNRCMPVAQRVGLGDLLQSVISHITTLETQIAAMAVGLNADTGVASTNYAPTTAATPIAAIPTK